MEDNEEYDHLKVQNLGETGLASNWGSWRLRSLKDRRESLPKCSRFENEAQTVWGKEGQEAAIVL